MNKDTPAASDSVKVFFSKNPEIRYGKGEHIALAGEPLPGISYITAGQIQQYAVSDQGDKIVLNVYKPGAFFPISWALNGGQNEFFFEAVSDVTVRQTSPEATVDFLQSHPEVVMDLLSRVYRGTDGLLHKLAHLMGGSARTRLIHEIITTAKRYGESSAESNIELTVSSRTLGERTGLSPETVSRELKKMKSDGLLEVTSGKIVVSSLTALEAFVRSKI